MDDCMPRKLLPVWVSLYVCAYSPVWCICSDSNKAFKMKTGRTVACLGSCSFQCLFAENLALSLEALKFEVCLNNFCGAPARKAETRTLLSSLYHILPVVETLKRYL